MLGFDHAHVGSVAEHLLSLCPIAEAFARDPVHRGSKAPQGLAVDPGALVDDDPRDSLLAPRAADEHLVAVELEALVAEDPREARERKMKEEMQAKLKPKT